MKYRLLIIASLFALAASAQTTVTVTKKNQAGYLSGYTRIDSTFSLLLLDTATTKASYSSQRMAGRLARNAGIVYIYEDGAFEAFTAVTGGGGGSGTVTSVAVAVPSGFSVSGSPVTGAGTITISAPGNASTQYINGAGGASLVSNLPISTATQAALDGKIATYGPQTSTHFLAGPTPSFRTIADADLPTGINANRIADGTVSSTEFQYIGTLSSNAQDQINLKAALASPALTGTPTVPTAAPGTNTTQAASTAFVTAAVAAGGGGSGDTYNTYNTFGGNTERFIYQMGTPSPLSTATINYTIANGAKVVVPDGYKMLQVFLNDFKVGQNSQGFTMDLDTVEFTNVPTNSNIELLCVTQRDTFLNTALFNNTQALTFSSGTYTPSSVTGVWNTTHAANSTLRRVAANAKVRFSQKFTATTRNMMIGFATSSGYHQKTTTLAGFWFDYDNGQGNVVVNGVSPSGSNTKFDFPQDGQRVGIYRDENGAFTLQVYAPADNGLFQWYDIPGLNATPDPGVLYLVASGDGTNNGSGSPKGSGTDFIYEILP